MTIIETMEYMHNCKRKMIPCPCYRVTWRVSCHRTSLQQRLWTNRVSHCRCAAALHQAYCICTTMDLCTRMF